MAAGDITYDTGSPIMAGEGVQNVLTGTVAIDDTYRTFTLLPSTSYIVSCSVMDSSGAGSAEVDINLNASGTTVNGTIACVGNHKTANTYRYRVSFV